MKKSASSASSPTYSIEGNLIEEGTEEIFIKFEEIQESDKCNDLFNGSRPSLANCTKCF